MRILLILAGLMLPLAAAPQEIYRWVDKDGIVHYSDQPGSPDAKLVTVVAPNAYESQDDSGTASPSYDRPNDSDDSALYRSITIVQPTADQVFFGSDATVSVISELDGELQPDHTILMYVDGNLRYTEGGALTLTGLPRGSHFVRAAVFDNNSKQVVISSPQVTFHVRQTSRQNPQSPVPARPQVPRPPTGPVTPVPPPNPAPAPSSN